MSWHWNILANRYQDDLTGQFISHAHVLELIDQSMLTATYVTDSLAGFVASGTLNALDWKVAFQAEIKGEYIRQYLAGIGGRNVMTQADWGSIGGMLKEQYGYLNGFYDDIAAGRLTEGQIRARMAMYINSGREAYERAHGRSATKWGADEVAWIINPAVDNCPTCEGRALMGWMPKNEDGSFPSMDGPVWPGSGASECLTNCKCSLVYRNSKTDEIFEGA